jgi:hypothetical protein
MFMIKKNKPLFSIFITILVFSFNITLLPQTQNSRSQDSENINIGMFSVVGNNVWSPVPGTQEFRNELQSIWQGTNNGYTAINSLHAYGHYIGDSLFWINYLSDISSISDSLKTLGDCRFDWIDKNNDGVISQNELDDFILVFENFLSFPNTDHILGWYIADEPSAHDFDSVEVEKIYSAVKQRDNRPIYIAEAPGEANYARFLCDVLIIDNYYYSVNSFADIATLAMWRYLIPTAREQLQNAGREDTEIHALLVLGEEIYPDSLNEEFMATHGLTHSAIRRVLELGVDGIWFYAWRAGVINSEDAVERWLSQQYYAEAVETEVRDKDFLVTAFNNQSNSKIVVSDIGNGQPPNEGSVYFYSSMIDALTSSDFQGSNDLEGKTILYDLSYRIEEGYRSNGDGDDELITAFNDGNIFYNESGTKPDEQLIEIIQGNVSAMISGDFDGDGDSEIVTAVQNGSNCRIFVSDDGEAGSIVEYQIYSSSNFRVTSLTAGDFNGDGRDELVTAISNSQLTESYIYVDDISTTGTAAGGSPWYGPSNEYHITALASGDFANDNNYKDRLIFALSNSNLMDTKIYCTALYSFSFDSSEVFWGPDNYWQVTAMGFGDFADDSQVTEELIIAFSNSNFNHTTIYKTENPVISGIGTIIYDPGFPSEYFVSSFSKASFRESLHPVTSVDENQNSDMNSDDNTYFLSQNFPNPFNSSTNIVFQIPPVGGQVAYLGFVSLKVYDVLGREVATLLNEEKPEGYYTIKFDASLLPSGTYFYRLIIGNIVKSKKMLLLK